MPWYVSDLIFQRSVLGGIMCIRCASFFGSVRQTSSTSFVGIKGGRLWSHRPVFLLSGWPNWYGCTYWAGLMGKTPTGFSNATLGACFFACSNRARVHSIASIRSLFFGMPEPYQRLPETASAVHGGCIIIKSQPSAITGQQSPV